MTRMEASRILGLRSDAAEDKVKEAHRRIMVANHPDSGGSSYLAAKVGVGSTQGTQHSPAGGCPRALRRCALEARVAARRRLGVRHRVQVNMAKDLLLNKHKETGFK